MKDNILEFPNVVESFTDDEMNDFTEIVIKIISMVCEFANNHNFDRDSVLKYLAQILKVVAEISTIANYKEIDDFCHKFGQAIDGEWKE